MMPSWVVPDTRYDVLFDGWRRVPYRPRHCKPPAVVRAVEWATETLRVASERYIGLAEEETITGAARPAALVLRPEPARHAYYQRKCTNTRPKFLESFSTR
jgi:hypothetical protein